MGISVLYVDGDAARRSRTATRLETTGLDVTGAATVEDAERTFSPESFDCVVTERSLPDGTGFDLIRTVRKDAPGVVSLIYTANALDRAADDASDVLAERVDRTEPAALSHLRTRIRSAVDVYRRRGFPVPSNEGVRLNAVRSLDLSRLSNDTSLDVLAQTAAQEFDTTAAFVGVVDDEQEHFLAIEGLDWKSLPRANTICTHALLTDDVTVIPDITDDPRFTDIPELRENNIQSYAGARIDIDSCGVGMVCILDTDTRTYSASERIRLREYAKQAASSIRRHDRRKQIDQ